MVQQKLQPALKKFIYQENNEEETHRKVRGRDLVILEGKGGERARNIVVLRSLNSENTSTLTLYMFAKSLKLNWMIFSFNNE